MDKPSIYDAVIDFLFILLKSMRSKPIPEIGFE